MQRGVTLIELMIGLVIFGLLLGLAMPSFTAWIQNTRIRTTAESIINGMQLARAEAVRRNANVRFQMMSSLTSACAFSDSGTNWVVARDDASGKCNVAASNTVAPRTIQSGAGAGSSSTTSVAAADAAGNAAHMIVFNGMGQVVVNDDGSGSLATVNVDSSVLVWPDVRPLRIVIGTGGSLKMCDPNVSSPDTRACS